MGARSAHSTAINPLTLCAALLSLVYYRLTSMTPLPIDLFLNEIVDKTRAARSLVLVAPPGAGKTTRVPPALLRDPRMFSAEHPNLIMLQPRRVAARSVAARIADENNWKLGEQVGYHVRFDRMLKNSTRLRVLTEGILTRQLLDDPFLTGIGAVLLDEFHERSLYSDIAIALLREVQQTVRPDLILMIMSATLEAEPAAKYLGDCPIVRAQGRTYPIDIHYAATNSQIAESAAGAVENLLAQSWDATGDILVFLPGAEEIRRTQRMLERHDELVLPLYGALTLEEQNQALRPAKRRKVILATNIAETSLTIDGVRTVIDTGYARVARYDTDRGLDRLDLERISKASAQQRAGRAGRTAPGVCVRLWSEKQQHGLADFDVPDVHRVDLAGTVLSLHAWGKPDVRGFNWYEPPREESLDHAEALLHELGALDRQSRITPLGQKLVAAPTHPRLARLLLAAGDAGCGREGAALAAMLSEKDIVVSTREREAKLAGQSDLLHRLTLLERAEQQRFSPALFDQGIDPTAARQVARVRDELFRLVRNSDHRSADDETLLKLPLLAYPDRVCKRREKDPSTAAMVGGGGVKLAAESCVRRGDYFLAIDPRHDPYSPTKQALVKIASHIEPQWLAELFPQSIRQERGHEFHVERQRIVAYRRTWYLDLLMDEDHNAAIDPQQAAELLASTLKPRATEIFTNDESAAAILARVELLRKHMPEQPWPEFDLADALATACIGKRAVAELDSASLTAALMAMLPYPLDRLLEQHAPTAIEVPTGNRIRLQYAKGEPPILAVRLQELFGLPTTPRIAGGRVPVKLHLLAPNYRPVQITDDLASFWANTYAQVRKDLRARYPKHSWPDDPLTAPPQAKGGRRSG